MKICSRETVYLSHSRKNRPGITVEPGETFKVRTELNSGTWLKSLSDRWHPEKTQGTNLANCIEVSGALPGMGLLVTIVDIEVEGIAYTGFAGWRNPLSQAIFPNDWDIVTKTVKIENNTIFWSDRLCLPVCPMVGMIGVAPAEDEIANATASRHGGNMDVQEICAGATVYLPVFAKGALLHVGDVHAIMGDGEINRSGGLECRACVTMRVKLLPQNDGEWIRIENPEYIMAVACCEKAEDSFCEATRELIKWMCRDYGFEEKEAYLLLGQVMQARCTSFVNPQRPYICKIGKRYLA